MSTNRDITDAELLCVAAATALPTSPASSPVRSLASQLHTAHIGTPMETTNSTTPLYTSGPHAPVKLLPFDSKQPKRWFQQTDAIFRRSHVVSSQEKWDYVLPKMP